MNYVSMQLELKTLGSKLDDLCKKIDGLAASMEAWKMTGHDNSRDIEAMKLEMAKMQIQIESSRKGIEKMADTYRVSKSYLAGGIAVATVVATIVMYVIDKIIK